MKWKRLWKKIGPGFVTGSSDDDPSGIATYTQAGAAFGLHTLWTAWLSFPLMVHIQEMCARIGLVQRKGLAAVIKKFYPRWLLYVVAGISFPAIILNIGADIAAMGAVANLLIPAVHPSLHSLALVLLLVWGFIRFPYKKIADFLKWLSLALAVYIIVPFMVQQDIRLILRAAVVPHIVWTKEFLLMMVAVLGTTISPYLFFWQANMEEEEIIHKHIMVDKKMVAEMQSEIRTGMLYSVVIMFFITLTAGTVLHTNGFYSIQTVDEAARALKPLAGTYAYALFAIGVIGTGLLAIPVLAGSLSYMMAELFEWKGGLDKKFHQAPGFYYTMIISISIGLLIQVTGVSPVSVLLYTAVVYGLVSPVLIAVILHICNSPGIMGNYTNSRSSNFWGLLCLLIMSFAALTLLYLTFIG